MRLAEKRVHPQNDAGSGHRSHAIPFTPSSKLRWAGDSYDNALAETINGLYKTEVIRRRGPWRNVEAVEYATLEWVDWFNTRRLLEPIGDVPPAEFEQE
jgi:transposase InsO family protein